MYDFDVYKTIFETWRFQVDSYWTRNAYFAAFETAAFAGIWELYTAKHPHLYMGMAFSFFCICLTFIWFFNNRRTDQYVKYWWKTLIDIEEMNADPITFVSRYQRRAELYKIGDIPISYHKLIQSIPWLFGIAWFCLLLFGIDTQWHIWNRLVCH
jgi:hypothetical protein